MEDVYRLLPKRVSPEQETVSPLQPQKKTNINTHNNKNRSKRSAPVPSHLPCAPGWFARSPSAFSPQPQVAKVTAHCSAPLCRPGRASRRGILYLLSAGRQGQSEGKKPKGPGGEPPAGPRDAPAAAQRNGRPRGGAGRVLTGRLPAPPVADPPGTRSTTAELALVHYCVSGKPNRGCGKRSSGPLWRPEQDFFFFLLVCFCF